jgi:3-phosphoshikimate 1-carboxyvinyltransferase
MIEIKPLHYCDAVVMIPGSKSYTHRALIVSALADGESLLINALQSEDTGHTIQGLGKFGIPIFQRSDGLHILGKGGKLEGAEGSIYVCNSGTSMRFLTALSALRNGRTLLDGNKRMRGRPIEDLLNGLNALGVRAYSVEKNGCPPVMIESQDLKGGETKIKGEESSQFLSALLMIAPYAREDVQIEISGHLASKPYVDITLSVMSAFGVEVESDRYHSFFIRAGKRYLPRTYHIEGDASNASYFFAAAAITKGRVRVENFCPNSVQGDVGFLSILKKMGCEVTQGESWAEVKGKELHGVEVDMNAMPDLVPTLAVTSAFARGETLITNIGHLRLKESDRIKSLVLELSKMGIRAREGKDWLEIEGGNAHGAEIETYNDHRLAMSFAITGLAVSGVKIKGEECVNKSFPDFWRTFGRLYT